MSTRSRNAQDQHTTDGPHVNDSVASDDAVNTNSNTNADSAQASAGGGGRKPRQSNNVVDASKAADRRMKARERQRRKRERDRQNNTRQGMGNATFRAGPVGQLMGEAGPSTVVQQQPQQQQIQQQLQGQPLSNGIQYHQVHPPPPQPPQQPQQQQQQEQPQQTQPQASPADDARRAKVRESARLRQQKHRMIVKQRKMAELGLSMNADGIGGLEEMHYALGPDGQYAPVMPPPLPSLHPASGGDHHFAPGHSGGQTFASTLLLSFSCSPLLKQHLLRTLHMTNEELASLEPVLAGAWDQWDHARRMHYAEQAANANGTQTGGTPSSTAGTSTSATQPPMPPPPPPPHSFSTLPPGIVPTTPNDFHARFQRPLTAPSPFGANSTTLPSGLPGAVQAGNNNPAQATVIRNGDTAAASSGGINGIDPNLPAAAASGNAVQATQGEGGSDSDGEGDVDMGEDKDDDTTIGES